uniref:DDE-1 domain-containing protein n=1 Tax=Amphimedon queenslandica TaxID=400682 RepID=A0A1X7TEK1_AMPQE
MGFVKRKVSNAGKGLPTEYAELNEQFIADIAAKVILNDILSDLVINWDQTGLKIVPTGEWTMNLARDKIVPVGKSADKREITAVLAATATGKYLPPQLLFMGTTTKCHPVVQFSGGWDIWHSGNHWLNEDTMKRYLSTIIIPFISEERKKLILTSSH